MKQGGSWSVVLDAADDTWTARIVGQPEGMKGEYAFNLMKGRDRVAVRWYSGETSTKFQVPASAGKYHAIGFFREDDSSNPEYRLSYAVSHSGRLFYDLNQWKLPVFERLAEQGFSSSVPLQNGIHRFASGDCHIDIRVDGAESLSSCSAVLVCFGGAVPAREEKIAPFFSGIGVANKLKTPLLAVADPSLSLSWSLALGWYAGNHLIPNLQKIIAQLLDSFSEAYGVKFVIFGGSGGGFASLAIQSLMVTNSTAAVWNPQTSISKYWSTAVIKYLDTAFPEKTSSAAGQLYSRLDQAAIMHDLTVTHASHRHPVLYLQNQSDDFHVEKHAYPFARSRRARQISNTVLAGDDGLGIWFGCWGKGHAAPPVSLILLVLSGILAGKSMTDLALELEAAWPDCPRIGFDS